MVQDHKDTSYVDELIFKQAYSKSSQIERKLKLNNPKTDFILNEISSLSSNISDKDSILYKN